MNFTWRQILDVIFETLLQQIENKTIKPGTAEEIEFLKIKATEACKAFAILNKIEAPCLIKVRWNPMVPDDINIILDSITTKAFKDRKIYG